MDADHGSLLDLAIRNAFGTTAGLLAPAVMGDIVQQAATPAEGYFEGFFICGVIMLAGGIIGMIFIRPDREAARFADAGSTRLVPGTVV